MDNVHIVHGTVFFDVCSQCYPYSKMLCY